MIPLFRPLTDAEYDEKALENRQEAEDKKAASLTMEDVEDMDDDKMFEEFR